MPTSGNKLDIERFTGLRKAAILMVMIGDEASSGILRGLDEEEVQFISREIAQLQSPTPEEAEGVLEEFYQMSMAVKSPGNESSSLDVLQNADPRQLAKFIHSEHPQTIALILSRLNPPQAAELLSSLPAGMRAGVALRMATLDQIAPEIMTKIAMVIDSKLKSLGERTGETYGGVRAAAEILNRLDPDARQGILQAIEETNPQLCEDLAGESRVF